MKHIIYLLSVFFLMGCVNASTFGMKEDVYQRNLVSIKNKTIPFSMRYIHWEGNPTKVGTQKASFIDKNPVLFKVLEDTLSLTGVKLGEPYKVRDNLKKYFPEILAEIQSFAKANIISEKKALAIAGAYFYLGGCSIYINSSPFPFLTRNYDWAPTLVDGIISSNESTKGRHSSIVISASIFGSLSGINQHGLAIAIAGINSKKSFPDHGGISMPIVVKGILDKAKDVDSAIDLLKRLPHTTPCNYALIDKSGKMAVVEVASKSIRVRRDSAQNKFLTATNHFQLISNQEEDIKIMPNSLRRQKSIEDFNRKSQNASIETVFNFMGNKEEGPAMSNYSTMLGTVWTIVYIPEEKKMVIRIGLTGDQKSFSVGQKSGEPVNGNLIDIPPRLSDYL